MPKYRIDDPLSDEADMAVYSKKKTKLAVIMDKATDPAAGLTLGAPQADFVSSVTDQLNAGKALSGKQRAFINVVFRSIPNAK